jgi:hypothetical protein
MSSRLEVSSLRGARLRGGQAPRYLVEFSEGLAPKIRTEF